MSPKKKSSFTWNVQPYRWLYEMRNVYLEGVIAVSQAKSERMAGEITNWMKQTAPWTDRTGAARDSLEAYVDNPKVKSKVERVDIAAQESQGLREAQKSEDALLRKLNTEREQDYHNDLDLKLEGQLDRLLGRFSAGKVSEGEYETQRRMFVDDSEKRREASRPLPLSKVPEELSPVSRFYAQVAANRQAQIDLEKNTFPVATLHIGHRRNLKYFIWLEIANGGRYAIIGPTLNHWGRKFINELKRIPNLKQFRGFHVDIPSLPENIASPESLFAQHVRNYNTRPIKGNGDNVIKRRTYRSFDAGIRAERAYRKAYRKSKVKELSTGVKRKRTKRGD